MANTRTIVGLNCSTIARIVAHEWQTDGYLKPGTIKRVRRLMTEEFMSDVTGWR